MWVISKKLNFSTGLMSENKSKIKLLFFTGETFQGTSSDNMGVKALFVRTLLYLILNQDNDYLVSQLWSKMESNRLTLTKDQILN